jgi:cation diffusion facilitator family transporter
MDQHTSREPGGELGSPALPSKVRLRLRAGLVSLVAGSAILAVKFLAWSLTGSAAVYSDAMESIVNVVAAVFALGAIAFAARPADSNHPYGHGKMEFFTAVFEGGLVAFAAVMILWEAVQALVAGTAPRELGTGLLIVGGAGVANLLLGLYLVRVGRRTGSPALEADGRHVLSDFWTSAGIVGGLLVVKVTGVAWLDPVLAIAVGLLLGVAGVRLVRRAAGGLLDEEDPALLEELASLFARMPVKGAIEVHETRAIRNGAYTHVDAHVVVPEYWSVQTAHDAAEGMERWVLANWERDGEIVFHLDPCRRDYCARCTVEDCAVRREPFRERPPVTRESIVGPPYMPGGGRALREKARSESPE